MLSFSRVLFNAVLTQCIIQVARTIWWSPKLVHSKNDLLNWPIGEGVSLQFSIKVSFQEKSLISVEYRYLNENSYTRIKLPGKLLRDSNESIYKSRNSTVLEYCTNESRLVYLAPLKARGRSWFALRPGIFRTGPTVLHDQMLRWEHACSVVRTARSNSGYNYFSLFNGQLCSLDATRLPVIVHAHPTWRCVLLNSRTGRIAVLIVVRYTTRYSDPTACVITSVTVSYKRGTRLERLDSFTLVTSNMRLAFFRRHAVPSIEKYVGVESHLRLYAVP